MASAAEQMAANISWSTLGKATELRQRIFFTVGLLIVYRIGTYIPVPGIDAIALQQFMDHHSAASGIGGVLSMFTGGALARMGIFALGIMPYISASIIVQLLGAMWEPLKQLKKEGELGRKKINQYTRYGTVLLATFQAYGLGVSLQAGDLASDPGFFFIASCVITLVGGTMFLMWLGEPNYGKRYWQWDITNNFCWHNSRASGSLWSVFHSRPFRCNWYGDYAGRYSDAFGDLGLCCIYGAQPPQDSYTIPTTSSWHEDL